MLLVQQHKPDAANIARLAAEDILGKWAEWPNFKNSPLKLRKGALIGPIGRTPDGR